MRENNQSVAWRLYETGRNYHNRLVPNQYTLVETNTQFFIGNQWINLPDTPAMRSLPKPTFNILKRVASLFVASLTSSNISIRLEPLAYYDSSGIENGSVDAVKVAQAEVENLFEKFKLDYRIRDALFDGVQTGDYAAHFYFNPYARPYGGTLDDNMRGEICMELIDGINVIFGNPTDRCVETQPYILLVGRDTVENLRAERDSIYHRSYHSEDIQSDSETFGQIEHDNHDESGKALYVLLYTKSRRPDGALTVHVTKATRTATIYENIDTGLSLYPIAWGNWEKQKGQYHGRALITGMIPNQIFINTMFATAMRHLQLMAFPKIIYNADLIPKWTNEIGQAIGVHGLQPNENMNQVACHLQSAEISGQIFTLIDKAMLYTRECLGATDVQMGNIIPENTSAIALVQTNAEAPLENIRANLHEWVENIGEILLDFMGTYYGRRPVVINQSFEELDAIPKIDPITGQLVTHTVTRKIIREFDFSCLKNMWFNLRVDVGAATHFDEATVTETLDALRRDGTLDVIQYLERVPEKLIPQKEKLIEELRDRAQFSHTFAPSDNISKNTYQTTFTRL